MGLSPKAATIPSYRKHKASGQAVVTLNGVDHYLGPGNPHQSRAEYNRVVNQWLAHAAVSWRRRSRGAAPSEKESVSRVIRVLSKSDYETGRLRVWDLSGLPNLMLLEH